VDISRTVFPPVMLCKHAYNKTRRAIPALRTTMLHHCLLHFRQATGIGKPFDRENLLARRGR